MTELGWHPDAAVPTPGDLAQASDGILHARFEGAHRVAYWIACLQRGPTGAFRGELFDLLRRALSERDRVGHELGRRRLDPAAFDAELSAQARAEWKPTP